MVDHRHFALSSQQNKLSRPNNSTHSNGLQYSSEQISVISFLSEKSNKHVNLIEIFWDQYLSPPFHSIANCRGKCY